MPKTRLHLLAFLALAAGCKDSGTTSPQPSADQYPAVTAALNLNLDQLPNYASPSYPAHYDAAARAQDNTTAANPVTDKGATLGRVLFHDVRLSINNTISCAKCHQSADGFTDTATLSLGFAGVGRTAAHSMRLANARFYGPGTAFWDKRVASIEAQATQPIRNAVEMGFDDAHGGIDSLLSKMRGIGYYGELFTYAYGDAAITEDRIQRVIAQYVRSIVSTSSRFDAGFAQVYDIQRGDRGVNTPFPNFTAEENRGKQLFFQPPPQGGAGCAACHQAPTFALAGNSLSNGLDAGETRIFKSPSLKNVATTGPYMHDGRFATLDAVVEHYVSGVQDGPALDNRLRPGGTPQRLALTAADKAALVAFLRTLTDNTVTADPKFSSPFRQ